MNLNKQTITYSFIIIFIIITFIHLYKINNKNNNKHNNNNNKHNNNNNDKENFADLMESQNLQGFNVYMNSMNQVNFTENNKNLKTIIEEIMNEKASKNELTDLNNKINDAMPELSVISYAGSNAPTGWQLCNGEYLLFTNGKVINEISDRFKDMPKLGTTVKTPDLRGRFILGSGEGEGLSQRDIHTSGGEETHTLTIEEMPSHNHSNNIRRGCGNENGVGDVTSFNCDRGHQRTQNIITIGNTGGQNDGTTKPHNNMPPYYVLTYIIKQPSQPS